MSENYEVFRDIIHEYVDAFMKDNEHFDLADCMLEVLDGIMDILERKSGKVNLSFDDAYDLYRYVTRDVIEYVTEEKGVLIVAEEY